MIAAAVPVSTFLANLLPWWRFSQPDARGRRGSVGVFVAVISRSPCSGRGVARRSAPAVVVSATTMVVLALDVMTGSRLQLSSLMGLQPVVGGRFYGMGNVTFALFATATMLLCTAVADRFVRAGRRRVAAATVVADRPAPRSSSTPRRPGAATSVGRRRACPPSPTCPSPSWACG